MSTTTVVCVKVGFIRPEYNNLKEWMEDSNNVYIGRRGVVFVNKERYPKKDSIWANPYKVGKDGTREEVIEMYRKYILGKLKRKEISREELVKLKGKRLGCWCYPEPCHGDILVEIITHCIP